METPPDDFARLDVAEEFLDTDGNITYRNDTQGDFSTTNDDSLSDVEKWEYSSSFGPSDLAALENESDSSVDMNDFFDDDDNKNDNGDALSDIGDPLTMHQQAQHSLEIDVLNQTSVDLFDITKLLQIEFSKNPLSTQRILIRDIAGIYKRYGQHGSYLRLSENVISFLNKGAVVVRPRTGKHLVKRTMKDVATGKDTVIERKERLTGVDRATMIFAPISASEVKLSTTSIDSCDNLKGIILPLDYNAQSHPYSQAENRGTALDMGSAGKPLLESHLSIENQGTEMQSDCPIQWLEHPGMLLSETEKQRLYPPQQIIPDIRFKTIKELLPPEVMLNHDHEFTMTNDPESHRLLDPHNPGALPFYPVDVKFSLRSRTRFAAGSIEALNRIFHLTHLNAHHLLNYLTIKYTPVSTSEGQNPPAPPFALFRLGIQQLLHSNLRSLFTTANHDDLGLPPKVRALLKDLHENHQWGRGGPRSLQAYYTNDEALRHESWLLGREHLTASLNDTASNINSSAAGDFMERTHINQLNHVERQILQRATGVVAEAVFDDWWEDAIEDRQAWNLLRCWIRGMELKKTTEAKKCGTF